jgi:MIP family channel proteins
MEDKYKQDSTPASISEPLSKTLKAGFAEFIASILFIFTSCGAAIATERFQSPGAVTIEIAITFGFSLVALCFAIGHISGGHLNSVVSLCFALTGKISWLRCVVHFVAHFTGGLVGAALLRYVSPSAWSVDCLAANTIAAGTVGQAFLMELILTFFLMFVINAAADTAKSTQPLVPLTIGLTVTVCHFLAIPISGCSLNPTRSFASAAVSQNMSGCSSVFDNHWVFWVACPLGGILATFCYENLFLNQADARGVLKQVGDIVRNNVPFLDFHGTGGSKADLSSVDTPQQSTAGHAQFEDEE